MNLSNNSKKPARNLRKDVKRHFLVIAHPTDLMTDLSHVMPTLPEEYFDAAKSFQYNLEAAVATISIPLTLAMASARGWRFRQLHIAELVRSDFEPGGDPDDPLYKEALLSAQQKMQQELGSEEGVDHLADSTCEFLMSVHKEESVVDAAAELLRQGTVLVWGAFEVLARDLLEQYVNSDPECGVRILRSIEGRRLFQMKSIDLDTLAGYDYDISNKLGTILVSIQEISNLATIKTIFKILFPENTYLREALGQKDLWTLSQRRHLIVHNRGIVDQRYLDNTGDNFSLGERLSIAPGDIERYVDLVQKAGTRLLQAASGNMPPDNDVNNNVETTGK